MLQQAITAVASLQDERTRSRAVRNMAPQLRGSAGLLQQALSASLAIRDESNRALALSEVVLQLEEGSQMLQEALCAASALLDEEPRARALSAVAVQLPAEARLMALRKALEAAAAVADEGRRVYTIIAVATRLQAETIVQEWAFALATTIPTDLLRARALSAVAGYLQGESRRTALQKALTTAATVSEHFRADTLTTMSDHLFEYPDLEALGFEMALALSGKERISITARLTRHNPKMMTYELWSEWLAGIHSKRATVLELIGDLSPSVIQLTGSTEQVEEIATAIRDICGWWP